ncbi:MAG: hypothetical protein R3E79_27915 [Caldilineaceae bacterium]
MCGGRFLTMLGFQLPEGLQEAAGTEFGGNLSMERADLLDVDVIIWLDAEEAEGELGGPVYQSLPVHTEGRESTSVATTTRWAAPPPLSACSAYPSCWRG